MKTGETSWIEAAMGCGAGLLGCEKTSGVIREFYSELNWVCRVECMSEKRGWEALEDISGFSIELGAKVYSELLKGKRVGVVGGDHACGVGIWSGLSCLTGGELGLIWIDAHLDGHTVETSPSKNIHGMVLAVLLGFGDEKLTRIMGKYPKLKAGNVVVIGVRSYEVGEYDLLKDLGVRIYFEEEVKDRGLEEVMREAYEKVCGGDFGVSIDADFFDSREYKYLGTPERGGFLVRDLVGILKDLPKERWKVLEFVELNYGLYEEGDEDFVGVKGRVKDLLGIF